MRYADASAFRMALEQRLKDAAGGDGDRLVHVVAAEHDAGDFFAFEIQRTGPSPERLGGAQRFRVSTALAGRPFEQRFLLDIAPRNEHDDATVQLTTPDLLAFAGIEPVQIAATPLERHLAEKLHAYTHTFSDGRENTRVKDLVDIALIAELSQLDATALHVAIRRTYAQRTVQPIPGRLPPAPASWQVPFRELAHATGIVSDRPHPVIRSTC